MFKDLAKLRKQQMHMYSIGLSILLNEFSFPLEINFCRNCCYSCSKNRALIWPNKTYITVRLYKHSVTGVILIFIPPPTRPCKIQRLCVCLQLHRSEMWQNGIIFRSLFSLQNVSVSLCAWNGDRKVCEREREWMVVWIFPAGSGTKIFHCQLGQQGTSNPP